MNRDFENEFGQEDERMKGRSRRRDMDAKAAADSDTASPRRPRSPEAGGTERETPRNGTGAPRPSASTARAGARAPAEGRPAGTASGVSGASQGVRPRYTGERPGERTGNAAGKMGERPVRPGGTAGDRPRYTGERAAGERPVNAGGKTGERPRFTGERQDGRPGTGTTGPKAGERPRYTGERKEMGAAPSATAMGTAGRAYNRAYAGTGDSGAGRSRETEFRRNGGGASGRRGLKEAATADPALMEVKRRRRLIITLIVLEILFLFFVGGYRYVQNKMSLIQPSTFKPADVPNTNIANEKIEEMEGYWTIALFGVDSRNNSVGKGNNADVIILCNVDQKTGEIKLVSIFRDTYLSISDNGTYNKINQAYFVGGPEQAVAALNRNLDLQIDDYATFNWKAVIDSVNILGGVDVELSQAEFYYINAYITETVEATGVGSHQLKKAGMNHLDGVQAVAYARLRKMDTDFARTERQREIINLCFQKLKKSDFSVVNNVMEVVFPQILSSITLDDVIPAAKNLTKYTIADTMGFPTARSDANMGKKGACVIPQTLESNVVLLHQFLFGDENYQPSDMVKKISAKISADTGLYNEGKPIESVGTDGGYIPKPTQATKATEKEETEESESETSTSETDESIIDGETDLELETDEDGNVIDPPEDYWPITRPGESGSSGTVYPGRPGNNTGESSSGSVVFPGAETSEGDQTTGPGAITRPGQDSTKSTSAPYPGSPQDPTAPYPGSTRATTSPYVDSTRGSMADHPGSTTEEYVPEGPGSIIIGPGN